MERRSLTPTTYCCSCATPAQFLHPLLDREWIPEAQRDILYDRVVQSAGARASQSFGDGRAEAEHQLWNYQIAWVEHLLERKDNARARQVLDQLPEEARKQRVDSVVPLEIRLAARTGQLATRLAQFEEPVPLAALRNAANDLREEADAASARRVLEYIYQHELSAGNLDEANFLGLAEIRLAERDVPPALALLRRMALVSGAPFATLDPAAGLLERHGRAAEAGEFLTALTKAEPWNADARRRLAESQSSSTVLTEVARSAAASYQTRLLAAESLRRLRAPALSGVDAELDLLSSQTPLVGAQIANPYAYESRLAALNGAPAQQETQLLAALAINPARDPGINPAINPAANGVRLRLFNAALAARHDSMADAIGHQLLPQYFREESGYQPYLVTEFLPQFASADRIAVARGLAQVNQRAGRWPSAELYYRIAQKLDPVTAAPALAPALVQVRAQADQERRNEQRRPIVSANLEQDRLVRPRFAQ